MFGECGTSQNGAVHHYYKCAAVEKRQGSCKKKTVRKVWLEDLVVNAVMNMIMDDSAIDAIVSMLMDLQNRGNTNLPLYERQLAEINTSIENLLNAIQQGILTRSTKTRLEELEAARDEAEARLACEKMVSPKISEEFMRFWLHRFRKLDVKQQNHRQMLIDSFINTIYLYDDKIVITFNYKEGTKIVSFDDVKASLSEGKSSDLDASAVPAKTVQAERPGRFVFLCAGYLPFSCFRLEIPGKIQYNGNRLERLTISGFRSKAARFGLKPDWLKFKKTNGM